jgi:predicted phosphodiesterase
MLGILYDIHGNLPALEATLADAKKRGVDRWLLGGDYGSWSPWPIETIELLLELPRTTWIRGNGERWIREPPWDRPDIAPGIAEWDSGYGRHEGWLYSLQEHIELDGVLYVHGCPIRDDESFSPKSGPDDLALLGGVSNRTIVFGHSHQQFRRPGPLGNDLINPGSVGMPLDHDVRGAYATRADDAAFELHRVEYDVEKAATAYEAMGEGFGKMAGARIRKGSD